MENFIYQNQTKIIFGRKTQELAGKHSKEFAGRLLLHYGEGSIKKSGLYDEVIASLEKENIKIFELGGVKPNPGLGLINEGSRLCKENNIDFILAVGGGSVIDSAKGISVGAPYKGDNMWDFVEGKAKTGKALPIGVVLTIPAAGSESSNITVITKEDGMIKKGYHNDILRPRFAILNPELTFTLPLFQMACGAADIMAHVMERYFTINKHVDLTDRLCEATLKTVIENAPLIMKDTRDYDPRAELMWSGTIAHGDLLSTGRIGDWGSHKIAHELSSMYEATHGAAIAVIFPAWMKYVYKNDIDRFYQFSVRVFDIDPCFGSREDIALKGIEKLQDFFSGLGLPRTLKGLNIGKDKFEEMADKATRLGPIGKYIKLNKKDVEKIYNLAS